jgi:hypothetical protein
MPNQSDANIKLAYPVDVGTFFTLDVLVNGTPFDVIANVEVGENIMQSVDGYDLWVSVRNLSQSTILLRTKITEDLPGQKEPLNREIRAHFDGGWDANDGDVLEALTAFKVRAGVNSDFSTQRTGTFMVAA